MTSRAKSKLNNETPRFYEMDGALRAYSNRSIVLACLMGLVALIAVVGFLFVRMEPPTVIRMNSEGEASVISPYRTTRSNPLRSLFPGGMKGAEPDELTKQAFVKTFLVRYLNYDSYNLGQNWADAMNLMTKNLQHSALTAMEKNDTVGKLEEELASSTVKLSSIEKVGDKPPRYTVFGVRTVRSLNNNQEQIDQLVEEYHVQLKFADQSEDNPAGLLIDDYWSNQIEGEKRDAVLADSTLANTTESGSTARPGVTNGGTNP